MPLLVLSFLFFITEVLLRLGIYDRWVLPASFLGESNHRYAHIQKYGVENINWITVGDSRIDWGIDHRKIAAVQRKKNINHLRFSFGSSNFVGIQSIIDWSIENLPKLQGIMLGITETNFGQYSNLSKQYKVVWPFKQFINLDDYKPIQQEFLWKRYIFQLAWFNYFEDIKDFLSNPIKRIKKIKRQSQAKTAFDFLKRKPNNLCAHPLDTLENCIASIDKVDISDKKNFGFRLLHQACGSDRMKKQLQNDTLPPNTENPQILINNWVKLFQSIIDSNKKLTIVLLPEHESSQYVFKSGNASIITNEILKHFQNNPSFHLIDLRKIFNKRTQCELFADPTHFSNEGIKIVTENLVESLEKLNF